MISLNYRDKEERVQRPLRQESFIVGRESNR